MFGRNKEAQKWADAKTNPAQNAKAAKGLTPDQIVARQTKASEVKNKSRRSR